MGTSIIKLGDMYLEWSSIVDAPVTFGMTRDEFVAYYRDENGRASMYDLVARLARADAKGTSSHDDEDVDDTIWLNRAGPGEIPLNKSEIIEWYCRRKEQPTAKAVAAHRKALPKCDPCRHDSGHRCECWGSGVRERA